MTTRLRPAFRLLAVSALLTPLCLAGRGAGQPPPPVPPNPQAPTLAMPTPLGIQRGTGLDLTLTGTNLAGPTAVWTSIPGAKVTIPADKNNGKDNASLRIHLEVPKDAALGFHALRLATTRGLSNVRLFCVDDLPQVVTDFKNRAKPAAQALPVPCVVVGRIDPENSDFYKVSVKPGQRLSFEVLGHRLGSALDPEIKLYDPRGHELAGGYSNDAPGLQTDARLTYVFKEPGDYVLEVRDVMYRGGADYWYRLRVGDFPCATTPIPLAAKRGSKVMVNFAGPTVEGVAPVAVGVPADPNVDEIPVAPRGANGLAGWPVALAVTDLDEVAEQEPNNDAATANRVPVPGAVSGVIRERGDLDVFKFAAKKGQRYVIEAHTHRFHSPAEVLLTVRTVPPPGAKGPAAEGTQVAASAPTTPFPRIDFTAPADADYLLTVDHLLNLGGPNEAYRVSIEPYEPEFELSLGIDRYDVPQGAGAALSVMATRKDYAGPIEVSVAGHPGITGQATIHPGQPAAPNVPAAMLFLTARPDVAPGPYTITVEGKAMVNGKPVVRRASVSAAVSQSLSGLRYPPLQLTQQVAIAVTNKPPFTLAAKFDHPEALRGAATGLTISATRAAGFAEEIALTPLGLPPNVAPALKNIPKGQNEIKVQLTPAAAAPLGEFTISFLGKAKFQNVDYSVPATPVALKLALPFDLTVAPAPLALTPGAKAKVKVTAVRKGGYQGPIAVELRNLPANVTAPKATIAMGQPAVDIEVSAAANAAVANKADVNVLGTATAAANQQNASPNFTISVAKK